jgi:transcriptional regulator with XRE-family HTH domain
MGRAALDWSVQTLAEKAGVGANTVSRFENAEVELTTRTARDIRSALEAEGVRFTRDGAGMPCVCVVKPILRLIRRPPRYKDMVLRFDVDSGPAKLTIVVPHHVAVPRSTLNDLDGNSGGSEKEMVESFNRNKSRLLRAAQWIVETEPARVQPDGRLYITLEDVNNAERGSP